jgi:hypothetical protein
MGSQTELRRNGSGNRRRPPIFCKQTILFMAYYRMAWEVEFTDEFGDWWKTLTEDQQDDVAYSVGLLAELGPALGFPHSSKVNGSRHNHMRELRTQSGGRPLRTLYAFDPVRTAILLLGGDKAADDRWYEKFVPVADRLYDEHLDELRKEGKL